MLSIGIVGYGIWFGIRADRVQYVLPNAGFQCPFRNIRTFYCRLNLCKEKKSRQNERSCLNEIKVKRIF